jgi:hypothetical protein
MAITRAQYADTLAAELAHGIKCHACGDTDYPCSAGRARHLASYQAGVELKRNSDLDMLKLIKQADDFCVSVRNPKFMDLVVMARAVVRG